MYVVVVGRERHLPKIRNLLLAVQTSHFIQGTSDHKIKDLPAKDNSFVHGK